MNGVTIFNHSARQVLGNLGMAARISGWFFAILILVTGVAFVVLPDWAIDAALQNPGYLSAEPDMSGSAAALGGLAFIVFIVFALWSVSLIAIVWHRFILLEEQPQGLIPYRNEFRVGAYFWYGVGISILAGIVAAVIGGILYFTLGPSAAQSLAQNSVNGSVFAGLIGAVVLGMVVTIFYLRMALILPAVALDYGLTLGKAWEASKGFSGAIAMLAVMLIVMSIVVEFVITMLLGAGIPVFVTVILGALYDWFYFMLNISILSTLYGHIVQKREIY